MANINSWDAPDFPQRCNDGTYNYGCGEHGGYYNEGNRIADDIKPPSINLGDTYVEMRRNGKKNIFDVSSLTENERIGIFIGATLVVLYLLK